MSEIAIRAEALRKVYRIGEKQPRYRTLRDAISSAVPRFRRRGETAERTFEALKNVSLEIKQGEVVGIIGHNGAGKSTLLKILARITEPTSGHAEIRGRLAVEARGARGIERATINVRPGRRVVDERR